MISDNVCETINEEVCETVNDEECTTIEEESCLPSYKQECTDIQELEVGTTVQVYNKTTSGLCICSKSFPNYRICILLLYIENMN